MTSPLSVLFEDASLIAIDKPPGLLVHRGTQTSQTEDAVLQRLRRERGHWYYPIHRLDRATSGILVLAKSREVASILGQQLSKGHWHKSYLAIVRGWINQTIFIDKSLPNLDHEALLPQTASTLLSPLCLWEWPEPVDRYPKARYSMVHLEPQTGRQHQLRRHCTQIRHPIIGDTVYGHGIHNRFFRERWQVNRLLLHHAQLTFPHPLTHETVVVRASLDESWLSLLETLSMPHGKASMTQLSVALQALPKTCTKSALANKLYSPIQPETPLNQNERES